MCRDNCVHIKYRCDYDNYILVTFILFTYLFQYVSQYTTQVHYAYIQNKVNSHYRLPYTAKLVTQI